VDGRLPAHLEISGLIRAVQAEGGFATVVARGEKDAGSILVVTIENGANAQLYERMPQMDGSRSFTLVKAEDTENKQELSEYLAKRRMQDPDSWIVELDIADATRFIDLAPR